MEEQEIIPHHYKKLYDGLKKELDSEKEKFKEHYESVEYFKSKLIDQNMILLDIKDLKNQIHSLEYTIRKIKGVE